MSWRRNFQPDSGPSGTAEDGRSAYEIAVENGFVGTEAEWLESLRGPPGQPGLPGDPGQPGDDGQPGPGLPTGGVVGQVPKKSGAADYATSWADANAHSHAAATQSAAGFMAAPDKGKLDELPAELLYQAPSFTAYSLNLAAATWTRLNNGSVNAPQVSVPALPLPPPGIAWRLEIKGFVRLANPTANTTVYIDANLNNGPIGQTKGGLYMLSATQGLVAVVGFLTSLQGTAFTVDFGIWSSSAITINVLSTSTYARCYLTKI